jgi:Na+/proline symporter
MNDLYRGGGARTEGQPNDLLLSRIVSLLWCILLVAVAVFFVGQSSGFLVELALSIASVTYGGTLGVFLLGTFFRRPGEHHAIAGFVAGIMAMTFCFLWSDLAWTWFTFMGACTTVLVALLASLTSPGKPSNS